MVPEVVQRTLLQVDAVFLVDDCSTDDTARAAREAGAQVLRHALQRGAGRATATGLEAAYRWGAHFVVTLDADGQHLPEEIPQLLEPLHRRRADLVVGCRSLEDEEMPPVRRAGNRFANLWTRAILGVAVADTQSGFRAYNRKAIEKLPMEARGYEFCSHTLGEAVKAGLAIEEVPVSVVYTEYSQNKGQSLLTSVRTLGRIAREGLRQ